MISFNLLRIAVIIQSVGDINCISTPQYIVIRVWIYKYTVYSIFLQIVTLYVCKIIKNTTTNTYIVLVTKPSILPAKSLDSRCFSSRDFYQLCCEKKSTHLRIIITENYTVICIIDPNAFFCIKLLYILELKWLF